MTSKALLYSDRFFIFILIYGFVAISWNLGYNSAHLDEVLSIFIGQKILTGESCYACKQYIGSAIIQPVFAAIGDYYGGICGARAVGIFFGLGLTATIYGITRRIFDGRYGLLAATLFIFSGTLLYLSKLATYDIVSAFFLGLAFYALLVAEKKQPIFSKGSLLFSGAFLLFLSAMIKYTAVIFIPLLAFYVFMRNKSLHSLLFFLCPLVVFILIYGYVAVYPARYAIGGSLITVYEHSHVPLRILSNWTFRWVAMPYLLSIFGLFHEERGKSALLLIFLSLPIILFHIFTGIEHSLTNNVIYSFIFLAPAAALGVDHLGNIFSFKSTDLWVKRFFISIILIVLWVFGFQELRWLEKQYPNMNPIVEFFKEKGFNNMDVAVDSDYGVALYIYYLDSYYPSSRFFSVEELDKTDIAGNPLHKKVDFIIFDDYYGKQDLRNKALNYLQSGFFLMKDLKVPLSWGVSHIKIFRRR